MLPLLVILGGVALLLHGVRALRKGLDRLCGPRLGPWMASIGSRRGLPFASGLVLSILTPSSTTVSMLAVQTVQAGYLSTRQMLAVMFGADIGLTVLVQLVAVRLDTYAPVAILFGVALFQFTKRQRTRGIGQVILGLGFIFLAIGIIRVAVIESRLAENPDFVSLIGIASRYPLVLTLLAAVVTMTLQSSTATIGLIIGLSAAGAASLRVAIPVVIGANVGMALTTLVIGFRQVDSKRLAAGNLICKVLVAVLALAILGLVGERLPEPGPQRLGFWVAQIHTAFNVVVAAIGVPAAGLLATGLARIIAPAPADGEKPFGPKFIGGVPIGSVTLGMSQSLREIMHVSEIVRSMLDDVWRAMKTDDAPLARAVAERDDEVDLLDTEIKRFLTRLVREESDQEHASEQMRQLRYLNELENVGDIIDKNISELVLKRIRLGARFTEEGETQLDDYYRKVAENLLLADTAFATRDPQLAQKLMRHKERIDRREQELRDEHFARLNEGLAESYETSAIHLDLLTHLKRINSCVTHVAYATLQHADRTGG